MISNGSTTYFHQEDPSVRLTTDANGNMLAQQETFPFGEQWYRSGQGSNGLFTCYESWNRYPYGCNDPIDITDPSGQSWWKYANR